MKRRRWLVGALSAALMLSVLPAGPGLADHAEREATANLTAHGHSLAEGNFFDQVDTGVNSDLAFWGTTLYNGNYNGFRIVDISNPEAAVLPTTWYKKCQGGQGDVIVWGDEGAAGADLLVRAWDVPAPAGRTCGERLEGETTTLTPAPVAEGFEGLHLFDVSDPQNVRLIGEVDLSNATMQAEHGIPGCGSHTLTMVPDPQDTSRLLVYSNHSGTGPGGVVCNGIDIVEVPLDDPSEASFLRRELAGRPCHDVTVFMGDVNRVACAGGNGFTLWSTDAEDNGSWLNPKQLYSQPVNDIIGTQRTNDGASINPVGHSAAFTWDGQRMIFGHEPGGGAQAECQRNTHDSHKKIYYYDIGSSKLSPTLLSTWYLERYQTRTENCTLHNFNFVPTTDGKDILVMGNYQAGTWAIDFTNAKNPHAIAFSDPAPLDENTLILGGAWSSHSYNGYIYESEITKGVHVFELNDPAVANEISMPFFNPQTQMERAPQTRRAGSRTNIKHRNQPHRFQGTVKSGNDLCVGDRTVVVKKRRSGRPDRNVGRRTTNNQGKWRVPHNKGGAGRYYAVILSKTVQDDVTTLTCRGGQSVVKRVNR